MLLVSYLPCFDGNKENFSPSPRKSNNFIGGSAKAAADLVHQLKGQVIGFLFILEIPGLNGRDKLGGAPTSILIEEA